MTKEALLPLLLENRELNKKQDKALLKLFKEIAAKSTSDRDADDWFILGFTEMRDENFDEAIDTFTFALEENPDFEAAYRFRGAAYLSMEAFEQAEADINKALELDPEYADAFYERANLHMVQGNWDKAVSDCDKVLELEEDHHPAVLLKAKAQYDSGKYEEAIKTYDAFLEENPKHTEALSSRGLANFFAANYEQAESDIRKARMLEGGSVVSEFNMGLVTSAFPEKSKESYRHFEKAFRKQGQLLQHYVENAAQHESERLLGRLAEILKSLESEKDQNFYTRELFDLLERKLRDATQALEEKKAGE